MKCCPRCFTDAVAQEIVSELSGGLIGNCDFCQASDVPVCELEPESELSNQFESLLGVFAPRSRSETGCMLGEPQPLHRAFVNTWNVFSFADKTRVIKFLSCLFPEERWFDELVNEPVVVGPMRCTESIAEYSFFGSGSWDSFVDSIKYRFRFHSPILNEHIFASILDALTKEYLTNSVLYRARLWNKEGQPSSNDLCEAPSHITTNGRMNVKGIPCLYIADSPTTAIAEIRAALHDDVAVAALKPKKPMRFVDLSKIDRISPFLDVDCNVLAVNIGNLKRMAEELLRPVRSTDSDLDYVPTQYLSDFIKQEKYDGIGYSSVMNKGGYNIACFRSAHTDFSFDSIMKYGVEGLSYHSVFQKAWPIPRSC